MTWIFWTNLGVGLLNLLWSAYQQKSLSTQSKIINQEHVSPTTSKGS